MSAIYFENLMNDAGTPELLRSTLKLSKQARGEMSLAERIQTVDYQSSIGNPHVDMLELLLVAGDAPLRYQECNRA